MKLSELTKNAGIPAFPACSDLPVTGVTEHSDEVKEGFLFVCVPGRKQNGAAFAAEAERRGAAVLVSEEAIPGVRIPVLPVRDAREALARLHDNYAGNPGRKMKLFAVTGTNGKTSVAFFLRAILAQAGYRTGIVGTVTNGMTTPDPGVLYPLLGRFAAEGCDAVVMEASSHALALRKLCPLTFEYGIFTNLTPEHLDFHGDMEHYFAAKASLFRQCRTSVIHLDDPYASALLDAAAGETVTYSLSDPAADYRTADVRLLGTEGIRYECRSGDRLFRVSSPIPGLFTVRNTLAAAAAASHMGIPADVIRRAIAGTAGVPGRMETVPTGGKSFRVFLDFAHTPDALENVLRAIRGFMKKDERLVLLFGCGGDRDRSKREKMGCIAARLSDFAIVTSDNPRSEDPAEIIREILRGVPEHFPHAVIPDRREAILYAVANAGAGDVILLAGKGHEDRLTDRTGSHPFSEKEIVAEALRKM